MTPSYGPLDIKAYVRRTTEASGVPYHVEDPYVRARIVEMFAPRKTKRPAAVTTSPKSPEGENE